jgi:hypothetical protein
MQGSQVGPRDVPLTTAVRPLSPHFSQRIDQFISGLEGWVGEAILPSTVARANKIAETALHVAPEPFAAPAMDGSILLKWDPLAESFGGVLRGRSRIMGYRHGRRVWHRQARANHRRRRPASLAGEFGTGSRRRISRYGGGGRRSSCGRRISYTPDPPYRLSRRPHRRRSGLRGLRSSSTSDFLLRTVTCSTLPSS